MEGLDGITSPPKTSSVRQEGGRIYIGKIVSVQGKKLFIEIPSVAPGFVFGPCRTPWSFWSKAGSPGSQRAEMEIKESDIDIRMWHEPCPPLCPDDHYHRLAKIGEPGDEVICAFLADQLDEVVVLGIVAQ